MLLLLLGYENRAGNRNASRHVCFNIETFYVTVTHMPARLSEMSITSLSFQQKPSQVSKPCNLVYVSPPGSSHRPNHNRNNELGGGKKTSIERSIVRQHKKSLGSSLGTGKQAEHIQPTRNTSPPPPSSVSLFPK